MTDVGTPPSPIPRLHPQPSLLRAYALGQLSELPHTEVETHALACAQCSAQIRQWRAELVAALETLPQPEHLPPLHLPAALPVRQPGGWASRWAWAAAVAGLLALGGVGWEIRQAPSQNEAKAERTRITRWLGSNDYLCVSLEARGSRPEKPSRVMGWAFL
jgi:anti-sigma factor RsiW